MKKILPWLTLLFILGCGGDEITNLKNSKLPEYPNTTLGQAFDNSFAEPNWQVAALVDGQLQITFVGTIKPQTHERALAMFLGEAGQSQLVKAALENSSWDSLPPSERMKLLTKFYNGYGKGNIKLDSEGEAYLDNWDNLTTDERRGLMRQFASNYWPAGSRVQVVWTSPDGQDFTISTLDNVSWNKFQQNKDTIFSIVFAK